VALTRAFFLAPVTSVATVSSWHEEADTMTTHATTSDTAQRIDFGKLAPEAMKGLLQLEAYVRGSVEARLLALIKLRASIANGCAYCIDMHTTAALRAGESSRRLFAVAAWRESTFFTRSERAALALTDAVTTLGAHGVSDEIWREARELWSDRQVADLVMAIVMINAWNRIAVSTHMAPPAEWPAAA
jgi:AhpD family alkylhydroperoxidase